MSHPHLHMASRRGAAPLWWALCGSLASALLYACLSAPVSAAPLAWLALVPLLWAVDGARPGRAAALGGLFGFVTTVLIIAWLAPTAREYYDRPLPLTLAFVCLIGATTIAPYFAAAFGLLALIQPRVARTTWLLLIPAGWVAAEYARTHLGLRSTWSLLGTGLVSAERLRQIASLGGVYALSALAAFANVALAECARVAARGLSARMRGAARREPVRETRTEESGSAAPEGVGLAPALRCAGLLALLLALAFAYGERSRVLPVNDGAALRIALVQGNLDESERWQRGRTRAVVEHYVELSRDAVRDAEPLPDLVVWPENAIQVAADDPVYGPILQRVVDQLGVALLIGSPRHGGSRDHYNTAFLLQPDAARQHYDKRRLLPFSETHPIAKLAPHPVRGDAHILEFTAGRKPGLLDWKGEGLGVMICFEAIYPSMARELVADGAEVLVNLSNDGWYRGRGGPAQHFDQVILRAVETGVPLLRATTTGITAVIAPNGEVIARLEPDRRGVLHAALPPPRARPTLYVMIGDVFAVGCCSALAAFALLAGLRSAAQRSPKLALPRPAELS